MKNGALHGKLGGKQGFRRSAKSCTRKEHESATNSIAQRGQGGDFVPFRLPLAGSRDSVPCGVWGNAPTVPRATSMPNALNKGAGSEASLPVTLRVLRRAPKLLYPPLAHCRAKWARPTCWSCPQAGVSPLRRRRGGNENRRSLRSPPTPLRSAPPCNWILIAACENGNIRKTRNIF